MRYQIVKSFASFARKMSVINGTWSFVTSSQRLYRSSQAVSVVGQKAFVFGGELIPREPIDNLVDVVDVGNTSGT